MRTFQIVLGGGILLGVDYDLIITSLLSVVKNGNAPTKGGGRRTRMGTSSAQ